LVLEQEDRSTDTTSLNYGLQRLLALRKDSSSAPWILRRGEPKAITGVWDSSIASRLILIDGKPMASLMVDHNVGASVANAFELKKMDID
jgi:hypothetical protein